MKFKDLNAVVAAQYDSVQFEQMTNIQLETEILRLFKEERKYSHDKRGLYSKVFQAIEAIDRLKPGFVAEATKDFRKLYFQGLAQQEQPIKKPSSERGLLKHKIKQFHFSQPRFKTIDDIKNFFATLLNNEVLTVTEGKYLQVLNKNQYNIEWLEGEINKHIKAILKEKTIDNTKVLSAVQALLYLNKITPGFLSRANKQTRHHLERCIEIIHQDKDFVDGIKQQFNAKAYDINTILFDKYADIDLYAYSSGDKNWSLDSVTLFWTQPVLEIHVSKNTVTPELLDLMSFQKILNLDLNDAQLKGHAFIPMLEGIADTFERDTRDFMRQTIYINFEIKLRALAKRYNEVHKKIQDHRTPHHDAQKNKLSEEGLLALLKEKRELQGEFTALRSLPVSDTCFESMLQHRNSVANRIGYQLTETEKKGQTPVYFTNKSMDIPPTIEAQYIPKRVWFITKYLKEVNHMMGYTEKSRALQIAILKHTFSGLVKPRSEKSFAGTKELHQLEQELETHRNKEGHAYPGERLMRWHLIQMIEICQLLDIDLDLQAIDQSHPIDIEKALADALVYPGFERLHADIEDEHPRSALEELMRFWPSEWKIQYQEDLELYQSLLLNAPIKNG